MRFTKELVDTAGGDWNDARMCNENMDTLAGQRVPTIELSGDLLRSKIAWKFTVLRQSLTYRLVDLGDAAISQWQEGNTLACIVLGRSFFETVAIVHSIAVSARKALDARDLGSLDKLAMQVSFGGRHPDWTSDGFGKAISVLTALDHLGGELPNARDFYERISELAHPNSQGTDQFYSTIDKKEIKVSLSRHKRGRTQILPHLMAVLVGVPWSLQKLAELDNMISQIADVQNPSV